jgi:TPR repeat protein
VWNRATLLQWIGTRRRPSKAIHIMAQYNLGRTYESGGLGVAKSRSLAVEWYRKAAIQGHDDAKDRLQRLLPGCS